MPNFKGESVHRSHLLHADGHVAATPTAEQYLEGLVATVAQFKFSFFLSTLAWKVNGESEHDPVGEAVGCAVGDAVGDAVGFFVGETVGLMLGLAVGDAVSFELGIVVNVGNGVEGLRDGTTLDVGIPLGAVMGLADGELLGLTDGALEGCAEVGHDPIQILTSALNPMDTTSTFTCSPSNTLPEVHD